MVVRLFTMAYFLCLFTMVLLVRLFTVAVFIGLYIYLIQFAATLKITLFHDSYYLWHLPQFLRIVVYMEHPQTSIQHGLY